MKGFSAALVLGTVVASAAAGDTRWHLVEEHWYTVEIAGATAGWIHESLAADGERFRSSTRTKLKMARGPAQITIELTTAMLETNDGKPIQMQFVQDMGVQSVETQWRFESDRVIETARQGDREIVEEREPPAGEWLTPLAARRYWMNRQAAGDTEITYATLNPQAGLEPIEIVHVGQGKGTHSMGGRDVAITIWTTTTSLTAGMEAIEWYTGDGLLVYQRFDAGLGEMVTRLSTKAEALVAEAAEAPEILVSTFIKASAPIKNPLDTTSAKIRLRVNEGTMPTLPSAGAQLVTMSDDGMSATLKVDLSREQPAPDHADAAYRARSAMVDPEDPEIRALADKATKTAGDDPLRRAKAMRAFVHKAMDQKGLDTAFATASETARTRSGDCSEHAVLLCAMLRADGIPARVAVGLIYADGFLGERDIFGWHMWTQALIDDRWVDLDATLPVNYHAGHVLTATSSLEEGGLAAELATTLLLIGNLDIEVLDVGYD